MFRKIAATSLIIISTIAFADIRPYVGINAGVNSGPWRIKNSAAVSNDFTSSGGSGGVFAGFSGILEPHMTLAAEVYVNGTSTQTRNKFIDSFGTQARLRSTYMTGVSFIPGYKITPELVIYVRGGAVATQFEMTRTLATGQKNVNSATLVGGQVGMGLQYSVTRHVKVRGEYNYTAYQQFNSFNTVVSPQSNQFGASVLYQF